MKPLLGRELMILTLDDDDDDVCMYVPKMSTWWDHLNIILPHVCAIQVCIYVDGGSYDDPKIDWLEADPFKWSVIIDLVWNRCCSVGYLWHCHLLMLLDTTT